MAQIPIRDAQREALVELSATGNLLDGAKVMLFTNPPPFVPTYNTVYADLTPPVTAGLATPKAIAWSAPYIGGDQAVHLDAPSAVWIATATPASAETVYGYAIVGDPSGTPFLVQITTLPAPVVFSVKYDGLTTDIDYVF